MNRSTRIIKRIFTLFLVVLMSIENFGAVVSDNDGSAFITKTEFDSKVNEFNTEINRYETSIDAKLQGAISSYVEGIRIQDRPTILYDKIRNVIGNNNPYFLNSINAGSSSLSANIIINKYKNYSVNYSLTSDVNPVLTRVVFTLGTGRKMLPYLAAWIKKTDGSWQAYPLAALEQAEVNYMKDTKINLSCYAWPNTTVRFMATNDTQNPFTGTNYLSVNAGQTKNVTINDRNDYFNICFDDAAVGTEVSLALDDLTFPYGNRGVSISYSGGGGKAKPSDAGGNINFKINNPINAAANHAGSGSQWTYELNPDGSKSLKRYWTSFYPQQNITLNYKTYKDYGTKTSVAQNDLKDDVTCVYTPSITPSYGKVSVGTNHTSYSTANKVGYCEEIFSLINSSTDTNDYRTAQWGNNTTGNIYVSTESPTLVNKSNNISNSLTDLAASTVSIGGVTHTTTKVTNNVKEVTIEPETVALNTFVNSYYTGVAGETVKMGYGIPIMMTNADNSARYTITLGVKQTVAPEGTTVASGNVTARLSLNHFVNGGFATSADRLYEGTISCNSSGVGTAIFTVDNIGKGQQLWLNLYGNTASRKVELTSFNVTMS